MRASVYIFLKTERIDVNTNPPIKAQFYSESGQNFWGGWDYSVYEFLDPTDLIKLNTKYLVIVKVPRGADITLFKTEHVVSWNQSQLNNENGRDIKHIQEYNQLCWYQAKNIHKTHFGETI